MRERSWQISRPLAESGKIRDLKELIDKRVENSPRELFAHYLLDDLSWLHDMPDLKALNEAYLHSGIIRSATPTQRDDLRAISGIVKNEAVWTYGGNVAIKSGQDLMTLPADGLDIPVLDGRVGYEIAHRHTKITELARAITGDPLNAVILVGALAVASMPEQLGPDMYERKGLGSLTVRTTIGASYHGDFLAHRDFILNDILIDPIGRETFIAPTPERVYAPAYHSTETGILRSLLAYQVLGKHIEPSTLHQRLLDRFDQIDSDSGIAYRGSLFADTGHDEGDFDRNQLYYQLSTRAELPSGMELFSYVIYPGMEPRLSLRVQDQGLTFYVDENGSSNERFSLDPDEIEDFITAMYAGVVKGRTSRAALRNVLEGLYSTWSDLDDTID